MNLDWLTKQISNAFQNFKLCKNDILRGGSRQMAKL